MGIPTSISKRLRACLGCSLIKTQVQFREEGCENCAYLHMKDNIDNVLDCTTDRFAGLIGLATTKTSWVAKWQHLEGMAPGMYAITIEGDLPESKIMAMEREGRVHIPRDKPFTI
ncbi:transcription elongation factor SPT4 [Nematocida displodere]|uniref:Transcription elongation factor SPT4 n=1 Tax=Nematocida displodere TaxID=1805483 RepID=A0A177EKJ0_9MICR|nr:transcription elongation factor SPT4 [Nematocida displodere]